MFWVDPVPFQMEHDLMVFNPSLRRPHKAPCLLNLRQTTCDMRNMFATDWITLKC